MESNQKGETCTHHVPCITVIQLNFLVSKSWELAEMHMYILAKRDIGNREDRRIGFNIRMGIYQNK